MNIPDLMPHQMEPFNGDHFIEKEFIKLRDRFALNTAIETGTCLGSTTRFLAQQFQKVFSIEINPAYLEIARTRIGDLQNVETIPGASELVLDEIIRVKISPTDRLLFFLDAHWDAHCPLRDELRIIAEHKLQPVIAIHDFQVPGEPKLAFDSYSGQPFTFHWLKDRFDAIYGEEGYDYYYNTEKESTEIHVGIIYVCPKIS
ncbi:MAG: hypothetical protein ABW007_09690 [Chitinophagaceae bacterium]